MKDIKLKDKIAQGINDLFYIWKREFQTTFRCCIVSFMTTK